jgi:hypothetical protein
MSGLQKTSFEGYSETKVLDLNKILPMFSHGKLYMADGEISKAEADDIFNNIQDMADALESYAVEISDLGETPGSESSNVEELPTSRHYFQGVRTNTVELNLIGLSEDRKNWLDKRLNKNQRTFILISTRGRDVLVFNGLRWTYSREGNLGELFTGTIKTQYKGISQQKYMIYRGIAPWPYLVVVDWEGKKVVDHEGTQVVVINE